MTTAPLTPNNPLPNPKHEQYAQLVATGHKQAPAYRMVYPEAGSIASRTSASQLANLPAVKARIKWLKDARYNQSAPNPAQKPPIARGARQSNEPPNPTTSGPVTRDEVVLQLSKAIRGGVPSDITAAASTLLKIMPEMSAGADVDKPDPVMVATYLAHWAGIPGYDLVKEQGGLELLMRKFIHVLRVDVRDFARMAATIARIKPEGDSEAPPQPA